MKQLIIIPNQKLIDEIIEISPPRSIGQEAILIYEGHVPNISLLLLAGRARFFSNKNKKLSQISSPAMICLNELITKSRSPCDVIISKEAKISFLDSRLVKRLSEQVLKT